MRLSSTHALPLPAAAQTQGSSLLLECTQRSLERCTLVIGKVKDGEMGDGCVNPWGGVLDW